MTPVSYIGLIAAILTLTLLQGRWRTALLVPTIYLAAFVWENVMVAKPEPARFVVLGAILIAVMVARPEGVLGEKRVEIV
jgi:ABC-type branched-subunit amino acid transport system permease subunit